MNNPKYYWLRWIGVLPSAVIGYLLIYFLLKLIMVISLWLNIDRGDAPYLMEYILPGIAAGYGSFCFVTFGAYLAPTNKRTTALVLLIIMSCFVGMSVFIMIHNFHWQLLVETLGNAIGCFIAYKMQEDENDS